MKEVNDDFIIYKKLVIFGDKGVGKSSFVKALEGKKINNNIKQLPENYLSSYVKYQSKSNQSVYFNIQEITITNTVTKNNLKEDITKAYPDEDMLYVILFNCECAILMIDILNQESFDKIKELNSRINTMNFPVLRRILVINKLDLETERVVSNFELQQYINSLQDIPSFHIALLSMLNVSELFETIVTIFNDSTKLLSLKFIKESTKMLSRSLAQASLKIVLLGNSNVGKSSFYGRYCNNSFLQEFISTVGIEKKTKMLKIFNELYFLQIWDTAGQEKYRSIPAKYYTNADGILLLYDINNRNSFNGVSVWLKDIQKNLTDNRNDTWLNTITLYLIGNKVDIEEREVEYKEALEFANKYKIEYYEVSCKWNLNINEVIHEMVFTIYKKVNKQPDTEKMIILKSVSEKSSNKKCCE